MQENLPIVKLLDLSGRVAIVTGGSKGIGLGISYRLAEAGATVIIADKDDHSSADAAQYLSNHSLNADHILCDVSSEDDVKALFDSCTKKYGHVDILVNNAGIFPIGLISNMASSEFDHVINTNLRSVFLTTKYGSEIMKNNGGGKIVNISSIDAIRPSVEGLSHYDASKHGVYGFTMSSALELARYNIQVNAVAPGAINTPGVREMDVRVEEGEDDAEKPQKAFVDSIPLGRMGEPDDIGKAVLFLASDMASYVTGSQIVVDGGRLLN